MLVKIRSPGIVEVFKVYGLTLKIVLDNVPE